MPVMIADHQSSLLPLLSPMNSSISSTASNIFSSTNTKKSSHSLASLLASGANTTASNGTSQVNNTDLDAYLFDNISPTKPAKAPKTTTPKGSTAKGSEQARRGTAANTGVKRFVNRHALV
jgi:hypothetical protein